MPLVNRIKKGFKIIDLDLYERDLSLVEFKSLFYDNNYDYFRPNKFDKNADVLRG